MFFGCLLSFQMKVIHFTNNLYIYIYLYISSKVIYSYTANDCSLIFHIVYFSCLAFMLLSLSEIITHPAVSSIWDSNLWNPSFEDIFPSFPTIHKYNLCHSLVWQKPWKTVPFLKSPKSSDVFTCCLQICL